MHSRFLGKPSGLPLMLVHFVAWWQHSIGNQMTNPSLLGLRVCGCTCVHVYVAADVCGCTCVWLRTYVAARVCACVWLHVCVAANFPLLVTDEWFCCRE